MLSSAGMYEMEPMVQIPALPGNEKADNSDALLASLLEGRRFRLRFPPVLEASFEHDTGPERCNMFIKYSRASLVLYNLFLIDYFTMLPDIAWAALFVQLCLITPLGFVGQAYTRTQPPAFWREATQVILALLSLAAAMLVYQGSGMPDAVFFRYSPVLSALFVNVVISVRFGFAVFASVVIFLFNIADLWRYEHATANVQMLIASSVVWTCGFTLLANYRLEKEQRRAYLLNVRDRLRAERVRHLAHHDGLTGLSNRVLLHERMSGALDLAGREGGSLAVLCLDLDRFKAVNDTLGHAAGDLLLQQVAVRLRQVTRAAEITARIGGDEFVVLQTGAHQPQAAASLAARLVEALSVPFSLSGQPVSVGTSVGIALFPRDGRSATELLCAADTALYRAKRQGGCTHCFHELAMDAPLRERNVVENGPRNALGTSQTAVHCQPAQFCHDRESIGFKALTR